MKERLGIDGRKTDWRKGMKRIKIGKICDVGKGEIKRTEKKGRCRRRLDATSKRNVSKVRIFGAKTFDGDV